MVKNERINYLDIAKGIAILLVILGHIYSENPVKVWLYSFHLPLFFFISGCLLSLRSLDNIDTFKIIKSKAKKYINTVSKFCNYNILHMDGRNVFNE